MRRKTSWFTIGIIAVCAAALCSCSSGNSDAPSAVDRSGSHSADWVYQHWDAYNNSFTTGKSVGKSVAAAVGSVSSCGECHGGDMLSTNGSGGIVRVGCFTASRNGQMCHPNSDGKLGHPTGWEAAPGSLHGRGGAMAAPGSASGFGYCAKCHGSTYTNGRASSCLACHTRAPHPNKPWHGTTASGTNHVLADPGNAAECAKCHANGANNTGLGIITPAPVGTAPGCFNNTLCHDYGHADYAPGTFRAPAAHGPRAKAALDSCQSCHASPIAGPNPRFDVTKTGLSGGCELCHQILTAHPTPWLLGRNGTPLNPNTTSHTTAGNLATACALCHGATLNGAGGVAPSCMSNTVTVGGIAIGCHTTSPASNPIGCISCHTGAPDGPNGPAAPKGPNRGYAHNKHTRGLSLACSVCHGAAGYGMASHADGTADMFFSSTYRANSNITITYDATAKTCAGVSCHGGQTTPDWRVSGSISVTTDCAKCHEIGTGPSPVTPQYNSYWSGKHAYHVTGAGNDFYKLNHGNVPIACRDCHNTDVLATKHFIDLNPAAIEMPPADTIGGVSTQVSSYNKTLQTCTTSCHVIGGEGAW